MNQTVYILILISLVVLFLFKKSFYPICRIFDIYFSMLFKGK